MEPEITEPATGGNKKKFLIISLALILVIAGATLGYLFMQKDTPEPRPEPAPVVAVVSREIPRPLSDEEKKLTEARVQSISTTPTLTKKEKASISQKIQVSEGFSILSPEEKTSIEERIIIQ